MVGDECQEQNSQCARNGASRIQLCCISLGMALSLKETAWMCNDLIRTWCCSQQGRWEKPKRISIHLQFAAGSSADGQGGWTLSEAHNFKRKESPLRSHAHNLWMSSNLFQEHIFPQPWNKCEPNCEKQTLTILLSLPIHSNNLQFWIITLYFFFALKDLEIKKKKNSLAKMTQKISIFEILIILLRACRSAVPRTLPSLVLTGTCLMRGSLPLGFWRGLCNITVPYIMRENYLGNSSP